MIDRLHERGIGVILDWVPAHFPRDEFALARFDGTALYEHEDPRRGAHPDWGTLIFNYGRNEVRNFLVASALYWLREYHADGLRVDAVASMLYRDYSRAAGEWVPNEYGGREDLEAIGFLRELNEVTHGGEPGVLMAAEESTAWPAVSRPTDAGGLGFDFKWNMGWMHDTLEYFALDPVHRRYHHDELTFSLVYAFTEQFVLPLSHDEVVHGKGSLLSRMPGDDWQKHANLRALYALHVGPPRQEAALHGRRAGARSRSGATSAASTGTCWSARATPACSAWCATSTTSTAATPALWELDSEPGGLPLAGRWTTATPTSSRSPASPRRAAPLVAVANLSPVPRPGYRLPMPRPRALARGAEHRRGGLRRRRTSATSAASTRRGRPWGGESASAELTLPRSG